MIFMITVNYLAVLAAAIAAFAIGALWYGPLFGKRWRALVGIQDGAMSPAMKSMLAKTMIGGFLATLVLVFALALLMAALGIATAAGAVSLAVIVSVGFIGTTMLNSMLYERKPWTLYAINLSHYIVAVIVAALVLALWQ